MTTVTEKEISKFYKKLLIPLAKNDPNIRELNYSRNPETTDDAWNAASTLYNFLDKGGHAYLSHGLNACIITLSCVGSISYASSAVDKFDDLTHPKILDCLIYYFKKMNFVLDDYTYHYSEAALGNTNYLLGQLHINHLLASQQKSYNGILAELSIGAPGIFGSGISRLYYLKNKESITGKPDYAIGIDAKDFLNFKDNQWQNCSYNIRLVDTCDSAATILLWTTETEAYQALQQLNTKDDFEIIETRVPGKNYLLKIALNLPDMTACVYKNKFVDNIHKQLKWDPAWEDN